MRSLLKSFTYWTSTNRTTSFRFVQFVEKTEDVMDKKKRKKYITSWRRWEGRGGSASIRKTAWEQMGGGGGGGGLLHLKPSVCSLEAVMTGSSTALNPTWPEAEEEQEEDLTLCRCHSALYYCVITILPLVDLPLRTSGVRFFLLLGPKYCEVQIIQPKAKNKDQISARLGMKLWLTVGVAEPSQESYWKTFQFPPASCQPLIYDYWLTLSNSLSQRSILPDVSFDLYLLVYDALNPALNPALTVRSFLKCLKSLILLAAVMELQVTAKPADCLSADELELLL